MYGVIAPDNDETAGAAMGSETGCRFLRLGIPGAAAYASSKAAIRSHAKTVALYCAQKGWAVLTPMWALILGQGPDPRRPAGGIGGVAGLISPAP